MGPLIPQGVISGDLNFFFAFIIGIAFGFLLEQAGFSNSRKLVGFFFGYDFAVLKVFLTAGITAAIGMFFFQYFGWIDINYVYVNPLFTWSAITGGAIMGLGFILGGFCPGTGFAAAAIGKVDALFFLTGMFAGVFLFGTFFNFFDPLYNGSALGRMFVYDSLGMSQGLFLFLFIILALAAFYITKRIEERSSRFKELLIYEKLNLGYPVSILLILLVFVLFLPEQRTSNRNELGKEQLAEKMFDGQKDVDAIKVAHSLMRDVGDLHLVDVRSLQEFNRFHLPGAVSIPIENLLDEPFKPYLHQRGKKTVFYSNGGVKAAEAWFIAERAGLGDFYMLKGGLNHFFDTLFGQMPDEEDTDGLGEHNRRFLEYARTFFKEGEAFRNSPGESQSPEGASTPIAPPDGGC
ncbi:MAG: YeeE/YedE thiosulfate transporter family protein [Cyclonatronaceae bacterium]